MLRKATATLPAARVSRPRAYGYEFWLAIGLLATAAILHVVLAFYMGAMWRDEITAYNLANMPTLGELWHFAYNESAPPLHVLLLRAWCGLGWGSDQGVRVLGLLIGLGVLASLTWSGRRLGGGWPLLALALFGLNPAVARFGDALRPNGLGVMLFLPLIAALWMLIEQPTRRRIAFAWIALALSIHSSYYAWPLTLGLGLATMAVVLRRRQWRLAIVVAAVGLSAALTSLVYLPLLKGREEQGLLQKIDVDITRYFQVFATACDASGPWGVWALLAFVVVALSLGLWMLIKGPTYGVAPADRDPAGAATRSCGDDARRGCFGRADLVLYLMLSMALGSFNYFLFLAALRYPTQAWYYLLLFALLCVGADATIQIAIVDLPVARHWRAAIAAAMGMATLFCAIPQAAIRQTNIDYAAAFVKENAAKDDLIVVTPWYLGLPFEHYYTGRAPWTTLPELSDHKLHRYDLIKERIAESDPLRDLLDRVHGTLKRGHRVWIVGILNLSVEHLRPRVPGPDPVIGWQETPYNCAWSEDFLAILKHAKAARAFSIRLPQDVMELEEPLVTAVEGWNGD